MEYNAFAREEEVRRFPCRFMEFIKSLDGHMLRSNRKMHDAFRAHFRNRFTCCPDLPILQFCSYLVDFLRFQEAEAASCEGLVTECEVCDALK